MTVAAVTMVYNEPAMLPLWLRHYSRQVGVDQCYVIDQGSDDGSTAAVGCANVIRVPRGVANETVRADFISDYCASLLRWFDWVVYADVDEMLVADPARYASLSDYCARDHADVVTAFGVNVLHRYQEPTLDPARPLLGQRRWMFAMASMAKPLLTRVPTRWAGGFHSCSAPIVFDGLTNFHLAYIDFNMTIARQVKRRVSKAGIAGHHHLMTDEQLFHMMKNWSGMPNVTDVSLDDSCRHTTAFVDRILASCIGRERDSYKIDLGIWEDRLWNVPDRFQNAF